MLALCRISTQGQRQRKKGKAGIWKEALRYVPHVVDVGLKELGCE